MHLCVDVAGNDAMSGYGSEGRASACVHDMLMGDDVVVEPVAAVMINKMDDSMTLNMVMGVSACVCGSCWCRFWEIASLLA